MQLRESQFSTGTLLPVPETPQTRMVRYIMDEEHGSANPKNRLMFKSPTSSAQCTETKARALSNNIQSYLYERPTEPCEKATDWQRKKDYDEIKDCTFKPKSMGKVSKEMVRGLKPWDERVTEHQRRKHLYIELKKEEIQQQIARECNFKPQINKKS